MYINIADYQGGSWYVGSMGTLEQWKNTALSWCDSDDNDELYDYINNRKASKGLIEFINEVWQIEIVKYDKNNEEHKRLIEERNYY